MKILCLGQLGRGRTSEMRADALERLGHETLRLDSARVWSNVGPLRRRWEQMRGRGPRIRRYNRHIRSTAESYRPDVFWTDKPEYVSPETLEAVAGLGATTVYYNPDPYFTVDWKQSQFTDACLPKYDLLVVTKSYELDAYREICTGSVVYSPLGFDPGRHNPGRLNGSDERWSSAVAFVGGWAPRRERLLSQARSKTPQVKIWGAGWRLALRGRWDLTRAWRLGRLDPDSALYLGAPSPELRDAVQPGETASGEIYEKDYVKAIVGARISPGFLRKTWPDQHTTRTFEIPAMGGFLLADRTEEHREFFEEDQEAVFFGGEEEFLDKLDYYLDHDSERRRIARAGRKRCLESGYSYDERLKRVLGVLEAA